MSSKVCVNCGNLNPVNGSDNRLVTESCGHVKCMYCLFHEKSGCEACQQRSEGDLEVRSLSPEVELREDSDVVRAEAPELLKEVTKGRQTEKLKDEIKKRKLDISHIRVEPEGSQNRYTCTICGAKFNARNHVVYHAYCNKEQQKPYKCTEPECRNHEGFSTNSHFLYHKQTHKNEKDHVCEECGKSFICKSKLTRHILKHTKEKMHACNICKKAFNNKSALRKHNLTHTGERPYACQTCGMRFRDSSNYKKHLAKHSGTYHTWLFMYLDGNICKKAFNNKSALRKHILTHTGERPYACQTCGMRFRDSSNYKKHLAKHSGTYHTWLFMYLDGNICKKAFNNKSALRKHNLTHTGERPYACQTCGMRFRDSSNYKKHLAKHSGTYHTWLFMYLDGNICKKAFNNKSALRKHNLTHTGERPYACQTCGMRFRDSSNYKKHLAKHSGTYHTWLFMYLDGNICKKAFNNKSALRKHNLTHTGERPYACQTCGMRFRDSSNYKKHLAKHSGTYHTWLFMYLDGNICKKAFNNKSALRKHNLTHTGERPYACQTCGMRFRDSSNYKKHLAKHSGTYHTWLFMYLDGNICKKAFNNKSALRKHNLTHTGERPYACQTCGMRFRDSSNYKKHLAKHSEKKCTCGVCGLALGCRRALSAHAHRHERRRHACERCAMAFHTSKDLRRHMLVHTDSKTNKCGECGRQFRRIDNLKRHVRNTHHARADTPDRDTQNGTPPPEEPAKSETGIHAKAKLEVLNPLPPLPTEVIKTLYTEDKQQKTIEKLDKSYIIEANHARESVIVSKYLDRKIPSPETEYVHKIRRANLTNKEITLPPIDEMKFLKVLTGNKNDLDVGPLDMGKTQNIQTYKSILHDKSEMHWKKRLADNE